MPLACVLILAQIQPILSLKWIDEKVGMLMAAVAKDIALGSVILVACIALLAIAFTTPSTSPGSGTEPVIAGGGFENPTVSGPDIPPVAPYVPPTDLENTNCARGFHPRMNSLTQTLTAANCVRTG